MRRAAILLLFLVLLSSGASALGAQEGEPLRFEVLTETGEAVAEIGDIFSDLALVEAVLSGLPLRIRIRVQLWKDGFFDDQHGQYEWRASVIFDPLTRRYRVQTSERTGAEIEVNTLTEAQEALQLTLSIPLRPREPGKYYYIGMVEMETLSLSDLEELQRWLQGELAPVVSGDGDVEGALARGFRRVLVRMLGLPARRFQTQSPSFQGTFRAGGGEEGTRDSLTPSAATAGR